MFIPGLDLVAVFIRLLKHLVFSRFWPTQIARELKSSFGFGLVVFGVVIGFSLGAESDMLAVISGVGYDGVDDAFRLRPQPLALLVT